MSVLDSVDQRTQLVGQNRLELLLFKLKDDQLYGINVFKVREVLRCPRLIEIPQRHPAVRGIAYIRGKSIPVLDFNIAIKSQHEESLENSFVIITEYNRRIQGFLVSSVAHIVNMNWVDIHAPPKGSGKGHYLTAVTEYENQLIEIIDAERILTEVSPVLNRDWSDKIEEQDLENLDKGDLRKWKIMIVDDSTVARRQLKKCLSKLGFELDAFNDGQEAFLHLKSLVDSGVNPQEEYLMVISDIEMPEMDGYTLVSSIKSVLGLKELHVVLHTSLSGVFNASMVKKVGANNFLAKFMPEELSHYVMEVAKSRGNSNNDLKNNKIT